MNTFKSHTSRIAMVAALLLAVANPVLADSDSSWFWGRGKMGDWFKGEMLGRHMMEGWGPGMMMGGRFNRERLNALKNELAITEAQAKAWDVYVSSVKQASDTMREAHTVMMNTSNLATLPERIALHEHMMGVRLESMKSIDAATLALYEALDNEQKKKADELIMGMGMM